MTALHLDLSSPEGVVLAGYALISGRATETRDWALFRSLHAPNARLMPVSTTGDDVAVESFDVDAYIDSRTTMLAAADFFEQEVARRVNRFQDVAHVWSAYEARRAHDADPFLRGVNSVQVVHRAGRWWILTVFWQAVAPDAPAPDDFFPRQ
ncbi:MAG: hypothetical protein ABJF01_16415 [bacterium]